MSSDFEPWPEVRCDSTQYTFCAQAALNFRRDKCRLLKGILIMKCQIVTCSAYVTNTPGRKEKNGHKREKNLIRTLQSTIRYTKGQN